MNHLDNRWFFCALVYIYNKYLLLETKDKRIFTEQVLRKTINGLFEESDIESDIADITTRIDDLSYEVDDDIGRMGYVRQLTAEFLEVLIKLRDELQADGIEIPETSEMVTKMMGRQHRKRYYMSKFRL